MGAILSYLLGYGKLSEEELEGADPESCISLFQQGSNLSELRKRLENADQKWMEVFLEKDGLTAIFECLRGTQDASMQVTCAACIKAVMNSIVGMDFIIENTYTKELIEEIDSENILVRRQIFELLSAVSLYSVEGHDCVIDALKHYKRSKSQSHQFLKVIQELKSSKTSEHSAVILGFVNSLIASANTIDERIEIRNELIALQLLDVIAFLKTNDDEDLDTQIDVFEESAVTDTGIDLQSHEDMFQTVYEKVSCTPEAVNFLSILQSLVLLEPEQSAIVWPILDDIVKKAVAIEEFKSADSFHEETLANIESRIHASEDDLKNDTPTTELVEEFLPVPSQGAPAPPKGVPTPSSSQGAPTPPMGVLTPPSSQGAPPPPPSQEAPPQPPPTPPPSEVPPPPPPPTAPGAPPPPPPPPPGSSSNECLPIQFDSTASEFDRSRAYRPSKRMKKLNWQKIARRAAVKAGSIWDKVIPSSKNEKQLPKLKISEAEIQDIEELFHKPVIETQRSNESTTEQQKPMTVNLLDPRTSLNVNIFLRQFKLVDSKLVEIIREGDCSDISVEQLKGLHKLLPDKSTADMIRSYDGDLSKLDKAEQFFYKLLQLKQYRLRIEFMATRLEFSEKLDDIKPDIDTLKSGMKEILESNALKSVFYLALVTGNIINGGGHAGNAFGFRIGSLRSLKDTRANKPRMSLLHYIVQVCEEQDPESLSLRSELRHLDCACDISVEYLTGQVSEMKVKLENLHQKIQHSPEDLKSQLEEFFQESNKEVVALDDGIKEIGDLKCQVAEYLCEDSDTFNLEECMTELNTFVAEFQTAVKENEQRRIMEEKRKKREEQQKQEESKKDDNKAPTPEISSSKNVIDLLLKKIRDGEELRTVTEPCGEEPSIEMSIRLQRTTFGGMGQQSDIKKQLDANKGRYQRIKSHDPTKSMLPRSLRPTDSLGPMTSLRIPTASLRRPTASLMRPTATLTRAAIRREMRNQGWTMPTTKKSDEDVDWGIPTSNN